MKIVETLKKTYLTDSIEETDETTTLKKAVVINVENSDEDVARNYVRSVLIGKISTVKLRNTGIESIQEAEEVSPLVELMVKYLPLAEKNAKATAVLAELDKLIGGGGDEE